MRDFFQRNIAASIGCIGLIGLFLVAPGTAVAALAKLEPTNQLPGIPASGAPSFVFNNSPATSFGGNVQSWFNNYAVIQNVGGASGSYNFFAHNEGSFDFIEALGVSIDGVGGNLDLSAKFDSEGNFLEGTIKITGAISELGINDPSTVLMTADLVGFGFQGNLVGYSIGNITCAAEIQNCENDPGDIESAYFRMAGSFAGIQNLNGKNYRSTIASITTVPIPAAVWLMLSGLGCIAGLKARRRTNLN